MLAFAVLGGLPPQTAGSATPPTRHVLLLHSYNIEFAWTRNIDRSLRRVLEQSSLPLEIHTEFMDAKRHPPPELDEAILSMLAAKYAQTPLAIIIVSDNDALNLVLKARHRLGPDVPVVFCGINRYSPALTANQRRITGVAEDVDMEATIALALQLHPKARKVVAIADDLTSAKLHTEQFRSLKPRFAGRVEFAELVGLSTAQTVEGLRQLGPHDIVLHFSFFRDSEGRNYSVQESVEVITQNSPAPVYTLWDWKVDWGVVGGVVASGDLQGAHAGEMAVQILRGVEADSIPVLTEQTTVPMFSYPAMTRFGITEAQLPVNTVILDKPFSFYQTYRYLIWATALVIALLLLLSAGLLVNVIRRSRSEAQLRQQKGLLRNILDNIPHMVFWKNRLGVYQGSNQNFAAAVGAASPDEIPGKTDDDMPWLATDKAKYLRDDLRVLQTGQPLLNSEENVHRKDGKDVTILVSKVPLRNGGPGVTGVLGLGLDITDRKELEARLRQAQKMEAVGQLAGGVAHDFNNLLTPILGYADLSQPLTQNEELRANLEQIRLAAEKAKHLVQQLLAFGRRQRLEMTVTDLNELIDQMEKILRRLVREDIRTELILRPGPIRILADSTQIQQVLMNLVVNASDAMPNGGVLSIETDVVTLDAAYAETHPGSRTGPHAMLAVSDTGVGMDAQTLAMIFEPFFTTKPSGKGTGLGLATVDGIVRQHGGSLWVYSEKGCGSTFKAYFPLAEIAPTSAVEPAAITSLAGTEAILVVEDDDAVRDFTTAALGSLGYRVSAAGSPLEAIKIAGDGTTRFDLLLTDVVMPDMNGAQLSEKLHTMIPALKTLFMSGYSGTLATHQGLMAEGARILQKPFTATMLGTWVRQILDGAPPPNA